MSALAIIGISVIAGAIVALLLELMLRPTGAQGAVRLLVAGPAALAAIWLAQGALDDRLNGAAPQRAQPQVAGAPAAPSVVAKALREHPEDEKQVVDAVARLKQNPRDVSAAMQLMSLIAKRGPDYALHTSDGAILRLASAIISGVQVLERSNSPACRNGVVGSDPDVLQGMQSIYQEASDAAFAMIEDAIDNPQPAPDRSEVEQTMSRIMAQAIGDPSLRDGLQGGNGCRAVILLYGYVRAHLSQHELALLLRGGIGYSLQSLRQSLPFG
jgi:hypothetical protein